MYINLLVPDFLIPAANAKCIRGKHLGSRVWNCPDAGNEAKILEWAQQGPCKGGYRCKMTKESSPICSGQRIPAEDSQSELCSAPLQRNFVAHAKSRALKPLYKISSLATQMLMGSAT